MKKFLIIILLSAFGLAGFAQALSPELAVGLSRLPLKCIVQQWPNKTSHLSDTLTDHVLTPSQLHPVFFGCLDWHSSVHGHWLLVRILKTFPEIQTRDSIIDCLNNSFQTDKLTAEAAYFSKYTGANTYERTYGWAWLLKLDEELAGWDNDNARAWHKALQPLTQTIVKLWKGYLPKQSYANRTGVHPNTAFGLAFALDWARSVNDTAFERMIIAKANEFYLDNRKVPAYFEPDATDFFSPTLETADLMRRVLDKKDFRNWFHHYFEKRSIERLTMVPTVSDRSDYQIVHLDGLSFSRAWCMKGIAESLAANDPTGKLFKETAERFIKNSLPNITNDNYGGSHWLGTFALYALQ